YRPLLYKPLTCRETCTCQSDPPFLVECSCTKGKIAMILHQRWSRLRFWFLPILFLLAGAVAAQSGSPVTYTRYDVTIELQEDGRFHVREEQQIRFEDTFRTAFAEIPLDYVSDIQNVTLSTPEEPFREVGGEPAVPGT